MVHSSSNESEHDLPEWPAFIKAALEMLFGEYQPDREVRAFISHWGALDQEEVLARVLSSGEDEEKHLAICIVGESDFPQARTLLLPFLQSNDAKARWLSALYLGQRKEAVARPTLMTMLTEFLPTEEAPTLVADQSWFDQIRGGAIFALLLWEEVFLALAFRRALLVSVNGEQFLPTHPVRRRILLLDWYGYQDALCYALGRRGVFGALIGIPLSPRRQRIAMVNMVRGYKQVDARLLGSELAFGWEQESELRTSVKAVLAQYFGLSEEEQNAYLDNYSWDLSERERALILDKTTPQGSS